MKSRYQRRTSPALIEVPEDRARRRSSTRGAAGTGTRSRSRSCRRHRGAPRTGPGSCSASARDELARWRGRRRPRAGCRSSGRTLDSGCRYRHRGSGRRSRSSETTPVGSRQPERMGGVVDVGQGAARLDPSGAGVGIDPDPLEPPRSMTRPSSIVPKPAPWWPPPRTAIGRSSRSPEQHGRDHIAGIDRSRDQRRSSVDPAVVDASRGVVLRVVRARSARRGTPPAGRASAASSIRAAEIAVRHVRSLHRGAADRCTRAPFAERSPAALSGRRRVRREQLRRLGTLALIRTRVAARSAARRSRRSGCRRTMLIPARSASAWLA